MDVKQIRLKWKEAQILFYFFSFSRLLSKTDKSSADNIVTLFILAISFLNENFFICWI